MAPKSQIRHRRHSDILDIALDLSNIGKTQKIIVHVPVDMANVGPRKKNSCPRQNASTPQYAYHIYIYVEISGTQLCNRSPDYIEYIKYVLYDNIYICLYICIYISYIYIYINMCLYMYVEFWILSDISTHEVQRRHLVSGILSLAFWSPPDTRQNYYRN